ncbi:MAG: radical SAM protein [Bacteroidaceae bacterium]|nr:radical SAM protein [Bacteroidaceae bacterium]
MATVIYSSPIFGPVHSRRLGVSLGINLMPGDGKVCSFDCLYCECGLNAQHPSHLKRPTREEVRTALEERLKEMKVGGPTPDVLTFAGNGEPTGHPDFAAIMDDVIALRNAYFPAAQVSVLSNATFILRPNVFDALMKVDNNILKLDTVSPGYIRLVNRPNGRYDLEALIAKMRDFNGHCIIQTLFMKGCSFDGKDVDNTGDAYVLPWLDAVCSIAPSKVMIYTIDRETPCPTLQKATHQELDRIASLVEARGIPCSVSY